MSDDSPRDGRDDPIVQLEPLGLLCGGQGTPLAETWIDLSAPSQVFYGLNGAGKTTVLDALRNALTGVAGRGRLITRIPFTDERLSRGVDELLSEMLVGDMFTGADQAHNEFVSTQTEHLITAFRGRRNQRRWEIEGTTFGSLNWEPLLSEMARSPYWLFTPVGSDADPGHWSASPVVLVAPTAGSWSKHLESIAALEEHDDGILITEHGLDLLWLNSTPNGAPTGIVGPLIKLDVKSDPNFPSWPFGEVITDALGSAADLTRKRVAAWSDASREDGADGSDWRVDLQSGALRVHSRANNYLAALLSETPALHLALGDEVDWFAGRSCTWTATRFKEDRPMPLESLSSAERRWALVAIQLALTDLPGTWLILDEPERGLHRTAEAYMARGVRDIRSGGARSVFATHSPDLLDHGGGDVSFVRRRAHDRPGAVIPWREFDGVREDLGLNPSDMLRRTRGIALVEGEHDLRILNGMIGGELNRLGVEILPLRGGRQLKTVVDSRFLYEFTDAILFPVLDDLLMDPVAAMWKRSVAAARTKTASTVSGELAADLRKVIGKGGEFLSEFLTTSIGNGTFDRIEPLGIPQSDILECLPVATLAPKFSTWEEAREAARIGAGGVAPSETAFKEFLKKSHRADLSAENLERLAAISPVHPDVKALLAAIDSRLSG